MNHEIGIHIRSTATGGAANRNSKIISHFHMVGPIHPYTTVTGFLFCICFSKFWEVIFEYLRHEKWSAMMTFLAVKNFILINITTKGERLTFHFYCCGKIARSCSNSYYRYLLSQLEEGVEILLQNIFLNPYFLLAIWKNRHNARLCTVLMSNIPLFYVFLEERY